MKSAFNIAPAAHHHYMHAQDESILGMDKYFHSICGRISRLYPLVDNFSNFIADVRREEKDLSRLSDRRLREQAQFSGRQLRGVKLKVGQSKQQEQLLLSRVFACVVEAADRSLALRHFDTQVQGGYLLFSGRVAEMATGEGKTLTATLAASAAALMGVPTHVVSANDYLTGRDAQEMRQVYHLLGIDVGCVNADTDQSARRAEYAKAITYCTNKDLVFDYLRDRMTLDQDRGSTLLQVDNLYRAKSKSDSLILRGLHYAIVDEADSVLIDDAKTPLIISASKGGEQEEQFLREAWGLGQKMLEGDHFIVHKSANAIQLTEVGKSWLEGAVQDYGPVWLGRYRREAAIRQALSVARFYQHDKHYAVIDGKVQIVDENTGRILPDRSWERGLHQLVEIKEGCDVTRQRETLAKISYQRFFRRYLHLAGMTGTAKEVRQELWQTYKLKTASVPTHKPCRREHLPIKLFSDKNRHMQAIVKAVSYAHNLGRPVLIGSSSIAESQLLSEALAAENLGHRLLNAKQDKEEAEIIAQAGEVGAITVATQMAGRGTDIKLSPESKQAGGLHVILCQRFDAARIDRQLAGRCARQGDPGTFEEILSVGSVDSRNPKIRLLVNCLVRIGALQFNTGIKLIAWLMRLNQIQTEHYHRKIRQAVFDQDDKVRELLAFSGKSE